MTPDTGPVSRSGIHVPANGRAAGRGEAAGGEQAADLGAIRRSDALIDLLAGRRRPSRRALRDPAIALLSSLTADIDAAPCRAASRPVTGRHAAPAHRAGAGHRPDRRASRTHRMGARHQGRMDARHQGSAAAAATAAIAMAAALAAAAGLVLAAMLTRLTGARGWDRSRGRARPGRPGRF